MPTVPPTIARRKSHPLSVPTAIEGSTRTASSFTDGMTSRSPASFVRSERDTEVPVRPVIGFTVGAPLVRRATTAQVAARGSLDTGIK